MGGRGGQRERRPAPLRVSAGQWFDALDRTGPNASPGVVAAVLDCHPDSVRRYRRRFGDVRPAELPPDPPARPPRRPRRAPRPPVDVDPGPAAPLDLDLSTASSRPVGDPLAELSTVLPPAHFALARLLVAAIVARPYVVPHGGRPAFLAYGAGGRGKTVHAEFVRHAFGWPESWPVVVPLHGVQAGELTGRLTPARGRFRFAPADYLGLPFVCADELDKARSTAVRADTFRLVDCDGTMVRERVRFSIRPVALVTFNRPAKGDSPFLTSQWRRRTIGLDADRAERPDPERIGAWLESPGPRFDLDAMRPDPAPSASVAAVRERLRVELADDGWLHLELRMLPELLAGLAAVYPGAPAEEIADAVAADLLALAETRGELRSQHRAAASAAVSIVRPAPALPAPIAPAPDDDLDQGLSADDQEALELGWAVIDTLAEPAMKRAEPWLRAQQARARMLDLLAARRPVRVIEGPYRPPLALPAPAAPAVGPDPHENAERARRQAEALNYPSGPPQAAMGGLGFWPGYGWRRLRLVDGTSGA